MNQILGIDAGNFETKIVHEKGYDCFTSSIGEWRKRTAKDTHSKHDMEFQIINKYNDIRGFAGPLAQHESDYGGTVYGITKNHPDGEIRILLGVHRNIKTPKVSIVVGQPYDGHNDEEKGDIIRRLKGEHIVTINGKRKEFEIENVGVAIEGAMGFVSNSASGAVNVIDVGSGTINCIHFLNKRIVDRKSTTLTFGSETNKDGVNYEGMASAIYKHMSALWDKNDHTLVCGGSAKMMLSCLKKYYPNAEILIPKMKIGEDIALFDTKFANAVGMYIAGVKTYGQLQTR